MSYGVAATIQYLYPRMLALHDLPDDACIPDPTTGRSQLPSLMRNSYVWMESNGLYLTGKLFKYFSCYRQ
jgi:protein transport protein SEC24